MVKRVRLAYLAVETSYHPNCARLCPRQSVFSTSRLRSPLVFLLVLELPWRIRCRCKSPPLPPPIFSSRTASILTLENWFSFFLLSSIPKITYIYRKRDRERLESFKILKTLRKRFWKWMKQEWRGMQCRQRKGDAFGGGRARKVGRGGSRGTRFEKISSQLPMAMLINLGAISSSPGRTPRHEIQFSSAWNSERSSQRGTRSRGPIGS